MATKYDKFIIREPIVKGKSFPEIHICGQKHPYGEEYCPGSLFPNFPNEVTMFTIAKPCIVSAKHAHDYDELLLFLGGNPINFFDYQAEAELLLGEEEEKHLINTTAIVYIPKGLMHCPIYFKNVAKPVMFMHICSSSGYSRSKGDLTTGHPVIREKYSIQELSKFKKI